jgi:hypothetical protein
MRQMPLPPQDCTHEFNRNMRFHRDPVSGNTTLKTAKPQGFISNGLGQFAACPGCKCVIFK